jgi:hypothetical protein
MPAPQARIVPLADKLQGVDIVRWEDNVFGNKIISMNHII